MNDLLVIRAVANMILQLVPLILIMPISFYELVLLFFIIHHNFCNTNIDKGHIKTNNFSTNEFLTSNSFIYHEFNSV